jgi:Fur family transcriptional regulator, stress-responsive regulator
MPDLATASSEGVIRARGQRVTALRVTILDLLETMGHASADSLLVATRSRLGAVSLQGLYDCLRVMEGATLVRKIHPAGCPALYERRVGDNHHHLVCRGCQSVADVECTVGHAPCLRPASSAGYLVDHSEVIFWGTCADCQLGPPPGRPRVRRAPLAGI